MAGLVDVVGIDFGTLQTGIVCFDAAGSPLITGSAEGTNRHSFLPVKTGCIVLSNCWREESNEDY